MPYITSDEINTIRTKANIVEIIGDYVVLTKKGKNFVGVCPFHDDHAPSMSVSLEKQIYKCFSCNAAGNVFTFVEHYENISFLEAVKVVADKIGLSFSQVITPKKDYWEKEHTIMDLAMKYYQNNLQTAAGAEARTYLKSRQINEAMIKQFKIGLALDEDDGLFQILQNKKYSINTLQELGLITIAAKKTYDVFTRRIIFPLWNQDGQVVAFSGRLYRNEASAKYINSQETKIFKKGEILYNYHQAKDSAKKQGYIIIVEGYMDAIRLIASGLANVVALMGTSLTKEQVTLLKKLRVNVVLGLDNDEAGKRATIACGEILVKNQIAVNVVTYQDAKDPDEYIIKNGVEKYINLINDAPNFYDYKFQALKANKDLTNTEELAEYINEIINYLNGIDDDILKEITINKLSQEYNIDQGLLKSKLLVTKPQVIKEAPVIVKQPKKTPYDIAAEKILYFMMNDERYIKMYNKQLGYFDDIRYREIASEIICYYEQNKSSGINVADFITHINNNEKVAGLVTTIVNACSEEELTPEAMSQYLAAADKAMVSKEISKLKADLKTETDINKKLEIVTKMTELKKGWVNHDQD